LADFWQTKITNNVNAKYFYVTNLTYRIIAWWKNKSAEKNTTVRNSKRA